MKKAVDWYIAAPCYSRYDKTMRQTNSLRASHINCSSQSFYAQFVQFASRKWFQSAVEVCIMCLKSAIEVQPSISSVISWE
jgi:thiaminase